MSVAMTEDRRLGDTDMHRRQRGKNLFMAGFLLALAAIFFCPGSAPLRQI
jgi:hypothetical protein